MRRVFQRVLDEDWESEEAEGMLGSDAVFRAQPEAEVLGFSTQTTN